MTKWARRVLDPEEIPEVVHQAFHHLRTGRPRPVEIEIPPETLADVADVELMEPEASQRYQASDDQIEAAAQMLAEATNPLIWAGGGAISSQSSDALLKVAEHLQAPVISTPEGKGAISDRHYLSLGSLWLRNDPIAKSNPAPTSSWPWEPGWPHQIY